MKLLVILLSLMSERFLVHQISYQRFNWFDDYHLFLKKKYGANASLSNPWLQLTIIVLPIVLITGFFYWLLGPLVFGLGGFIISFCVFFYCLGPQNVFYPISHSETETTEQLVKIHFIQLNRQLFALVFWYLIGGPLAALAYRMITLGCSIQNVTLQANELADILEWIPARITALLYMIVGNFQSGLVILRQYILAKPDFNHILLSECGMQAAKSSDEEPVTIIAAENLIEHAIILTLVLIALFTLISWL